jgi:cytochrome c553
MHKLFSIALSASLLALSPLTAGAADAAAGKAKTAACTGCHGADGVSKDAKTPTLACQKADALASALREYKSGKRTHAMMKAMAGGLSDADVDNVAAHYASLPCAKK